MKKVTDCIVEFLLDKGISDVFGFPGAHICHLLDSVSKYEKIKSHVCYNEQGAALAACGYAQAMGNVGVAFATSGPGATNLVTGVANAYFDCIPVLFITGQTETYSAKRNLKIRQRGFQETDVVSVYKAITKATFYIDNPKQIRYYLEMAWDIASSGSPGPVVLDIPTDVQRAEVDEKELYGFSGKAKMTEDNQNDIFGKFICKKIQASKKPVILLGNGIKQSGMNRECLKFIENSGMPVLMSMPAFDIMDFDHPLNFGFVGKNGFSYSNKIIHDADFVISLGCRMSFRTAGLDRNIISDGAEYIRIDIDEDELSFPVKKSEYDIRADLKSLLPRLNAQAMPKTASHLRWMGFCNDCRSQFVDDEDVTSKMISKISKTIPGGLDITVDVGYHMVSAARNFKIKKHSIHMSGGHGAMGYALPAAIGCSIASKKDACCILGDGGLLMNLQELQFLNRERLPVKIILINNSSLGYIRMFQDSWFDGNYVNTTFESGYTLPGFSEIAKVFNIPYTRIETLDQAEKYSYQSGLEFVEIVI